VQQLQLQLQSLKDAHQAAGAKATQQDEAMQRLQQQHDQLNKQHGQLNKQHEQLNKQHEQLQACLANERVEKANQEEQARSQFFKLVLCCLLVLAGQQGQNVCCICCSAHLLDYVVCYLSNACSPHVSLAGTTTGC
jgi:hypothetical protein